MNKLPMIECKDVESELQPGLIEVLAVNTGVESGQPETELFEAGFESKNGYVEDINASAWVVD